MHTSFHVRANKICIIVSTEVLLYTGTSPRKIGVLRVVPSEKFPERMFREISLGTCPGGKNHYHQTILKNSNHLTILLIQHITILPFHRLCPKINSPLQFFSNFTFLKFSSVRTLDIVNVRKIN